MDLVIKLMGHKIRKLRKAQGLSQQQLGQKAGFDYRYIGFIEQARVNPTVKTLEKVAGALDTTVTDLLPSKDEIEANKKGVAPKMKDREKVMYRILKNVNKIDKNKLKKIEKIVRITIE